MLYVTLLVRSRPRTFVQDTQWPVAVTLEKNATNATFSENQPTNKTDAQNIKTYFNQFEFMKATLCTCNSQ